MTNNKDDNDYYKNKKIVLSILIGGIGINNVRSFHRWITTEPRQHFTFDGQLWFLGWYIWKFFELGTVVDQIVVLVTPTVEWTLIEFQVLLCEFFPLVLWFES